MNKSNLNILRDYFKNIVKACNNKEKDERPYIKGVAECGLDVIEKLLKNE